ncbi:MAG: hypothetical protein AAF990_04995 [Bacteroidota bacterium]
MEDYDPKAFLLFALGHYQLTVVSEDGKMVYLDRGYAIEIEGQKLFKLLQDGQVIAPFADVAELCQFIKTDQLQYGKD